MPGVSEFAIEGVLADFEFKCRYLVSGDFII